MTYNVILHNGLYFYVAGEDFAAYSMEFVFSPFSEGGVSHHIFIRILSDSITEGSETFQLEATAGDWPFTDGGDSLTVTINDCTQTRKHSIAGIGIPIVISVSKNCLMLLFA